MPVKGHKSEKYIKESEKRLRLFIDSSPDLIFLKDKDGRYLVINKANADFFGKSEKEIIGKTDYDLMPKKAADGCSQTDVKAMKTKEIVIGEEWVGDRLYETRKIPVVDNGAVMGVAGIIRDVTDKKRAESEIEKKVNELKRANELMVGREIKMVELKKRIKELEKNK